MNSNAAVAAEGSLWAVPSPSPPEPTLSQLQGTEQLSGGEEKSQGDSRNQSNSSASPAVLFPWLMEANLTPRAAPFTIPSLHHHPHGN